MNEFVAQVFRSIIVALIVLIPLAWLLQQIVDVLYCMCNIIAGIRGIIADVTFNCRHRKSDERKPKPSDSTFPPLPM
jgi:hypothetical protein